METGYGAKLDKIIPKDYLYHNNNSSLTMVIVNLIYFLIYIISLAACFTICGWFCECMCRWADYWHELKLEEEYRQTQIVPRRTLLPPQKSTKIVPVHEYIVVMNPQPHPISLGLPKEYSNV